jgi:hypothetical protein
VLAGLLLAVLAIVPTRRLVLRGVSPTVTAAYFAMLWLAAFAILAVPGRPRLLLPIVVILTVLPFVTWRDGVDRLLGRPARRPPPRNVTPPEQEAASR